MCWVYLQPRAGNLVLPGMEAVSFIVPGKGLPMTGNDPLVYDHSKAREPEVCLLIDGAW